MYDKTLVQHYSSAEKDLVRAVLAGEGYMGKSPQQAKEALAQLEFETREHLGIKAPVAGEEGAA